MSDFHCVELEQQPCVVTYVKDWSSFLVGTYTLKPNDMKYMEQNNRVGSLVRLAKSDTDRYEIKEQVECRNGGVFDLKVRCNDVHVAHANNSVSIYSYKEDPSNRTIRRLVYKKYIRLGEDWSILLTSIDLCSVSCNAEAPDCLYTAVADSSARVTILADRLRIGDEPIRIIDKAWVVTHKQACEPVWKVRFVQPSPPELPTLDTLFLVACCEDKSWVFFRFDIRTQRLTALKKFTDFGAGVTGICIIRHEPTQAPNMSYSNQEFTMVMGSYDETVKLFKVKIATELKVQIDHSVTKMVSIGRELIESVKVPGAGIWQIMFLDNCLYMAGMFAGCYRASCSNIKSTIISLTNSLPDRSLLAPSTKEPALDYGLDFSKPEGVACVVDFNNKLCLFFK